MQAQANAPVRAQEDSDGIAHLVTAKCSHLPAALGTQAALQAQASAPPQADEEMDAAVNALGSKSAVSTSTALQAPAGAPSQSHGEREGDVETVEEVDISGPQHTVAAARPGMAGMAPGMAGLANNPAMMQQATSMMQNPAMMAQVSAGPSTAAVLAAAAAAKRASACVRCISKMQSLERRLLSSEGIFQHHCFRHFCMAAGQLYDGKHVPRADAADVSRHRAAW